MRNAFLWVTMCFSIAVATESSLSAAWALSDAQKNSLVDISSRIDKEQAISKSSLKTLEDILQSEPKNFQARILLGECYESLNMQEQATQQYKIAATNAPNDMTLFDTRESARVHEAKSKESIELAEIRLKQHRYMEAYFLAGASIAYDQQFWAAYKIKGSAAMGIGQFKEATNLLSVAFEHLNSDAQTAKAFALAALRSGQYSRGLQPALVYLALTSGLEEPSVEQKQLVIDLSRHLQPDEARAIVAHTEGQYGLAKNAPYHFAVGDVMDHLDLIPDAVTEYQRGLEVNPNFANALFRKGKDLETYYHRYDDALADYTQAAKAAPNDLQFEFYRMRLEERLAHKDSDLSWRLKDFLRQPAKQ